MQVLLCIMDGFGLREPAEDNAVTAATTPNYDKLSANSDHFTQIEGSGLAVGLPEGQMGNSEVGHLNIGAGRVVFQDVTRIDKAIAEGELDVNPVLIKSLDRIHNEGKALHLLGLVSDGKVHSSLDHVFALVRLAKKHKVRQVFLHAFTDGRDTSPKRGVEYLNQVQQTFEEIGLGQVATISGRYWGMDRDTRWDRVEKAYQLIVNGVGSRYSDPVEAIKASYAEDITDEFIKPISVDLGSPEAGRLAEGDTALFFNFRADRVREICHMLLDYPIEGINHPDNPSVELLTMTEYDKEMTQAKIIFEKIKLDRILGEIIAERGLKQLRTAETEKYAHVTFFFNGGVEQPFEGEDRDLIPSPKVATYDLQPAMSSVGVTDNAVEKILSKKYNLVVLNYANCDMVGHSGIFDAAREAVEAVDAGLGRLLEALRKVGGVALVTADHGNAEKMFDPETKGPWTAHTTSLVPMALFDPSGKLGLGVTLRDGGILADIAPTILDIMGIEQPTEMTGRTLLNRS